MKKTLTVMTAALFGFTFSSFADCKKCDKAEKECAEKCEKECGEKMEKAFYAADKDNDGKLSMVEFKEMVSTMKASKKDCDKADCEKGGCDSKKAKAKAKAEKKTS